MRSWTIIHIPVARSIKVLSRTLVFSGVDIFYSTPLHQNRIKSDTSWIVRMRLSSSSNCTI